MKNKTLIFILIAVGLVVYLFNMDNPLFWDDTDWIVNNQYVHSFSFENIQHWFTENVLAGIGLNSNYYRPFLMATFALNYVVHGDTPIGYHFINNGLHIANAILVFWLISTLFRRRLIGFGAALLFLVNPLQTEAVSYISGRGDPLSLLFMLLGLWAFLKSKRILAFIFLIFALLSRESAIVFPFLIMLVSYMSDTRREFWKSLKQSLLSAWPYFGVVVAYGILRLTVLNFDNTLNFYGQANLYSESILVRIYTFFGVLLEYAKLIVVPLGQHMERVAVTYGAFGFWQVYIPVLIILGFIAFMVVLYRKSKKNSSLSEHFRVWLFGSMWFFIGLGPTSGVTPINAQIYEHWLYVPLIGVATIVAFYGVWLWDRARGKSIYRYFIAGVAVVLLSWHGYLAIQRNILWGDPEKFYLDILKYEPTSARIMNNLGNLYYWQDKNAKAEEYYGLAVATGTSFPQPYYNLGKLLLARGEVFGATKLFEQAIEKDPFFPFAYQELAVLYVQKGDFVRAKEALEKIIEIQPREARAYLNLAKVELVLRNSEEAVRLLLEAKKYADNDPEAKNEIESLLERLTSI